MVPPRTSEAAPTAARPFLKWAGGKAQILEPIGDAAPRRISGTYLEPFLGGGAVFFHLAGEGRLAGGAFLSDVNAELVGAYVAVRDATDALIARLEALRERHRRDAKGTYYAVRAERPRDPCARAARFLYLNKTCFNGLWRVNASGGFNVPMGRYRNPSIFDPDALAAAARALRDAEIACVPFEEALRRARRGSFVYMDPPYLPVSRTANFTAYTPGGFGMADQERLADACARLRDRGIRFLLSNSDAPGLRALYEARGLRVREVTARRAINSDARRRGAVVELLVDGGDGGDAARGRGGGA